MGYKARRSPNSSTLDERRFARLRGLCLELPNAVEKQAWGDPTWRIDGRIFAMQKGNYEGGRPSVWLKAEEGAQGMLVDADASTYFVPPYVGHKGWVGIWLDIDAVPWDELEHLIGLSYQLIAR